MKRLDSRLRYAFPVILDMVSSLQYNQHTLQKLGKEARKLMTTINVSPHCPIERASERQNLETI